AVAAALQDGHVKLRSFDDAAVLRPAIQQFFERIEVSEESGPAFPRWTRITIDTRAGQTFSKLATKLRGAADCPLTDAALIEKADDCLAYGGYGRSAKGFAEAVFSLDQLRVSEMLNHLPTFESP